MVGQEPAGGSGKIRQEEPAMNDKKLFVILLVIFVLSLGLLIYAKTHVGQNFIKQFL